jgi:GH15 family glucan-1,4-alpha-glucosidase
LIDPGGGALRVGPAGQATVGSQRYDDRTNVVRTRLPAPEGEVEVADFMPWPGGTERPPGRIVRLVAALRGPVEVAVELVPGSRFGPAREVAAWSEGVAFDGLVVRCGLPPAPVPLDRDRAVWVATTTLAPGERMVVTVDDLADDHNRPLSPDAASLLLDSTTLAWRRHLEPLAYDGPYRAAVERSMLAVKALTHYASGGLAAAATTSLPRVAGGERNHDHRWAIMADACAAAAVTRRCGLAEEAEGAERWLRAAVEGAELPFRPVLDVEGGSVPAQEELALPGRRKSQPVRAGWPNAEQDSAVTLDLYGDLVGAVAGAGRGGPLTAVRDDLYRMADWVADHWIEPDRGVWGVRGVPRPFVSSRVQCWYALDQMVRLARAHNPLELATVGWQEAAAAILSGLETAAQAAGVGGLPRDLATADSTADLPDAGLLRIAWRGPWPADHPIVTRTVDRVVSQLSNGAYLYRYPLEVDDGEPGTPGADLVASFWAVRALAAVGRWEDAHERMETLCRPGPLGLVAEAVDPLSGDLLGNYPSSAAHLALVTTALALQTGPR